MLAYYTAGQNNSGCYSDLGYQVALISFENLWVPNITSNKVTFNLVSCIKMVKLYRKLKMTPIFSHRKPKLLCRKPKTLPPLKLGTFYRFFREPIIHLLLKRKEKIKRPVYS